MHSAGRWNRTYATIAAAAAVHFIGISLLLPLALVVPVHVSTAAACSA
jgi:hypothetical protein